MSHCLPPGVILVCGLNAATDVVYWVIWDWSTLFTASGLEKESHTTLLRVNICDGDDILLAVNASRRDCCRVRILKGWKNCRPPQSHRKHHAS